MNVPAAPNVVQLKVALADIKPPIWRRLQVPASLTLRRLQEVIQIAMGWEDRHLYEFVANGGTFGEPDSDGFVDHAAAAPVVTMKLCARGREIRRERSSA